MAGPSHRREAEAPERERQRPVVTCGRGPLLLACGPALSNRLSLQSGVRTTAPSALRTGTRAGPRAELESAFSTLALCALWAFTSRPQMVCGRVV